MSHERNARVLIISSGAIGAALMPGWVLYLRHHLGWEVRTCLTPSAERLVSTTALAVLSGHPAVTDSQSGYRAGDVTHRVLAEWPDVVIVAPATGNTLAKVAAGIADSVALSVLAFTEKPVIMVPSLTSSVFKHPRTIRVISTLRADGVEVMEPSVGFSPHLASEDDAAMPTVIDVVSEVERIMSAGSGKPADGSGLVCQ